tara:strand:- start:3714 stop:5207 length:1494 start_codon:yes stop_codon:yes gene_type:complete
MSKHNLFKKKVKKQILSINNLIESIFNKIKYFRFNYKKILLSENNRLVLIIGTVVILTLSYLLIPTFYNKSIIETRIKNQLLKNYGIDIKFNEQINYALLPKPHFSAKNLSILRDKKEIGLTKNLRVFIGLNQFFSLNNINMKNLVFDKTDFNIYRVDFLFFKDLLQLEPNDNKIIFKNSNIFFKNKNEEVLFINKIYKSEFYYDAINLQNVLVSKNEVYKVPFKLVIKNDKFNKKNYIFFNSKKIRLDIESETNYDKGESKNGQLNILFINKSTSLNYQLNKEMFKFQSKNNKNFYNGTLDFKPFYLSADFNYEGLSTKGLFDDDSILIDIISSEILNNRNLSANINLKIKDITNINELNNLNLKTFIEEGNINFSDSSIMWKEDLKIDFNETLLLVGDNGINLVGSFLLNFKNINNFYKSFQVKKSNRKEVKQIQLDFVYNLNSKSIRFDNPKIDNIQNTSLEEFLDNFNSQDDRIFNKITFKNFINSFFKAYAG